MSHTDVSVATDRLRVSLDHLLEGVQIIDRSWRYVYLNPAAAAHGQRSAEELLGRTMPECYPGIQETDLFRVLERVMRTRRRETLRNEFSYPTGDRRWFDLVIDPVPEGICVMSLDVTDRHRVELEQHHAHRMEALGQLAGGVAHDFNNQLTAILGFAELMLKADPAETFRRDLLEIRDAGQRAAALTRQLLAFSHRQPFQVDPIDLNAVVSGVGRLLERLLGADIDCSLRLHDSPAMILGDTQQLENVLTNLAVNARDAMPKGGRLTIGTGVADLTEEDAQQHAGLTSGRYAVLSVEDTGCGMDEETKNHIFEPFFTTKGLGRGTGLGLSMVYGIVKNMQGFVWVYSEVGRGTTFRLYFPLTGETAQRVPPAAPPPPSVDGRKANVLVIDDDAGIREFVKRTLERHGHHVFDAATSEEAWSCIRQTGGRVDLVLADVVLPGISGPDLVPQLETDGAKVLYMSGYSDRHIAQHGVSSRTLLPKPFGVADLLKAVAQALASDSV